MNTETAPNGLVHSLLLDGAGGATELDWQEVAVRLEDESCLWLHFDFTNDEACDWLRDSSGLNDIAYKGLMADETRPRAVSRGDKLLLVLRGINLNPGSEPEDMVSIRIWTDGKRIFSTRRRVLQSTQDILGNLEHGDGPTGVVSLLVDWTDRIVSRMAETVDQLEDEVAELESNILSGDIEGIRLRLALLRKRCISIRRWLAPQREALNRLYTENLSWLDELNRLRFREVADQQMRHIEDIDEVRERASMAQEELLGQVSEQMNARSYVFTVVATIFLPLGFFTGLMGINVGGMPGIESDTAFWVVVSLCVGVTATLAIIFRLKKWL